MRGARFVCLLGATLIVLSGTTVAVFAAVCSAGANALGVSRVIEIDTTGGPKYGRVNFPKGELLRPGEIILTFDDGPSPSRTKPILEALDSHCAKATFFSVGRMAMAYSSTLREVQRRGHTIAGHTWSHKNLGRTGLNGGKKEIETGFAALSAAVDGPVAPFFRFPYLVQSKALVNYLEQRNVAMWSVDVISNDSWYSASRIISNTLSQLKKRGRGIILFHDIKLATARAMPKMLASLKRAGYKLVHVRAKSAYTPVKSYEDRFKNRLMARRNKHKRKTTKTRVAMRPDVRAKLHKNGYPVGTANLGDVGERPFVPAPPFRANYAPIPVYALLSPNLGDAGEHPFVPPPVSRAKAVQLALYPVPSLNLGDVGEVPSYHPITSLHNYTAATVAPLQAPTAPKTRITLHKAKPVELQAAAAIPTPVNPFGDMQRGRN